MRCTQCGAESPASKRFCADCGSPLATTCPTCGAATTAGQRFCADCGTPLSGPVASGARPAVERRICSVLFCDLVGFTPLAEERDPEEVRELLTRYFDAARTVVEHQGGVVEKFIGDAVMAVWGTPTAAEGDAERAVRAALDLVAAVASLAEESHVPSLAARAGVVTGEVAVTLGAVGQGMVAGDAVNTAARVEAAAEPGTALVDDRTWRRTRTRLAFVPGGEFAVKGKAAPLRLWRAVPRASAGSLQLSDDMTVPLVDRDLERRMIQDQFQACIERHAPRLVSIVGPAGVGKSRLGREFTTYIDELPFSVVWHRGRCSPYGPGVAFWALAEMVRQRFGIASDAPAPFAAQKFTAGLDRWVPDPVTREIVRPCLARLLGVEADDEALLDQDELFAGWRLFFATLARDAPVVLLIEDLQHADPGLLDFLENLLDWARDVPIFVLTLSRPELEDRRPGWGTGRRNATRLGLEPLGPAAMTAMLDALVPGMPVPARAAIESQAQGVPLFAVETVRMLIDRDVVRRVDGTYRLVGDLGDLTVPETLQSLLAARLDALPADARRLIGDAAVLGTSFPAATLIAVSELPAPEAHRALAELVRRELLTSRTHPLSPDRGGHDFVHPLFRQVVYDTLSRRERKRRHLAVADHLAAAFPNDGEEVSEVIATHLLSAVTALPDAPDAEPLRERAVAALQRAASRAERTAAPAAALRAYAHAADLLHRRDGRDAELRAAAVHEQAAEAARLAGDNETAVEHLQRAAGIYTAHGLVRDAARAHGEVGRSRFRQGRYEESREVLRAALHDLEHPPDGDTFIVLSNLAWVEALLESPEADELVRSAFDVAETLELSSTTLAELFMARGLTEVVHQRYSQAQASLREAVRLAQAAGEARVLVPTLLNLSELLLHKDPHAAVETSRVAMEQARRVGGQLALVAVQNLVQALLLTGEWQEAQALRRAAEDEGLGEEPPIAVAVLLLADASGDRETLQHAARLIEESYGRSTDPQEIAWLSCSRALVAISDGRLLDALPAGWASFTTVLDVATDGALWGWPAAADAALALGDLEEVDRLLAWLDAHPPGHLPTVLRAAGLRVRAELAARRRDPEAAEAFRRALAVLRELDLPYQLAVAQRAQADWLAATGEAEQARQALAEARTIGQRLGATPRVASAVERSAAAAR